ncbi:TRF5 [Candida jiufengensis]|uniref:TRF5 n=1 Tax=Candida jiufengensis TaxID=497108 RepID=UPI002223FF4D|nr:TRF5 [Candida jiufengensis]KAI5955847.1 TRF5 [Candida jiufengensis]
MGSKRKRDNKEDRRLPKQKKSKTNGNIAIKRKSNFNSFENLSPEENSDSEYLYDYNNKENSDDGGGLDLIDSDDEELQENIGFDRLNESDNVEDQYNSDDEYDPNDFQIPTNDNNNNNGNSNKNNNNNKNNKVENEVTRNQDFIGFGISSSDEDEQEEEKEDDKDYDDVYPEDEHGNSKIQTTNSQFPWIKNHDHSRQKEIADWLTLEIKDFINYISPHKTEIITRNKIINNLKLQISKFWPGTETHVFGSCATDLYLPGSDIDLVIISGTGDYENRSRLYQLSSFLKAKNLAKNVEVIASAKVPIIKFIDPLSNLNIDVSFERTNGLDAARRIRKWLNSTPGLRELVLVVKQFLRSRKLNNVHVGGLGGYATIIMCYHFMRLHPKISTNAMNALDNLGVLLIEFFELYGRNFSYDNLIIALNNQTDEPKYIKKGKNAILNTSRNQFAIVIQDPADPTNNITRSSYNLRDLKKAFGGAFQLLVTKCYELNAASYRNRLNQSILGDIIKFKGKQRDFNDDRDLIVNDALINEIEYNEEQEQEDNDDYDPSDYMDEFNTDKKISKNGKYYFSDMTVESDDDDDDEDSQEEEDYNPKTIIKTKLAKKSRSITPTPITNKSKDTKKLVESFLSLEKEEEEDQEDQDNEDESQDEIKNFLPKKPMSNSPNLPRKPNLDKDIKRDYWRQKGLDM